MKPLARGAISSCLRSWSCGDSPVAAARCPSPQPGHTPHAQHPISGHRESRRFHRHMKHPACHCHAADNSHRSPWPRSFTGSCFVFSRDKTSTFLGTEGRPESLTCQHLEWKTRSSSAWDEVLITPHIPACINTAEQSKKSTLQVRRAFPGVKCSLLFLGNQVSSPADNNLLLLGLRCFILVLQGAGSLDVSPWRKRAAPLEAMGVAMLQDTSWAGATEWCWGGPMRFGDIGCTDPKGCCRRSGMLLASRPALVVPWAFTMRGSALLAQSWKGGRLFKVLEEDEEVFIK